MSSRSKGRAKDCREDGAFHHMRVDVEEVVPNGVHVMVHEGGLNHITAPIPHGHIWLPSEASLAIQQL